MTLVDVGPRDILRTSCPLYVDLDGTLVASDLMWESLLALLRARPVQIFRVPLWLCGGRANLKRRLAEAVRVDPALLPYQEEVVEFLRAERAAGRKVILATAADERLAREVANHLGVFDEVIASDGETNLKGARKLERIKGGCGEFGFDYIGDSAADRPLWEAAGRAMVVGPREESWKRAGGVCEVSRVFERPQHKGREMLRAMRPHQWAKNALLAVPLMASHQLSALRILQVMCAFIVFSLAASAVYVFNDLLDLETDRRHPGKRNRPFASGALSLPTGLLMACTMVAGSVGIAAGALSLRFLGLLGLYLLMTTLYSLYLKRKLMVDVLCLAGLYTLRILAGGEAAGVLVSHWLLAFSMFFFLSLAFCKRYTELDRAPRSEGKVSGRGYMSGDLDLIRIVGPVSGYLSVLVLCLYINSADVLLLYRSPAALWMVCPLLLYWITRVWFLAQRRLVQEDPVLFAVKDRISYITGVLTIMMLILASVGF